VKYKAEAKYEEGKSQAQQTYDKAKGKVEAGLSEAQVRLLPPLHSFTTHRLCPLASPRPLSPPLLSTLTPTNLELTFPVPQHKTHDAVESAKSTGSSWFGWGSSKKEEGKQKGAEKVEEAAERVKQEAQRRK
jgi:hypothetical protein